MKKIIILSIILLIIAINHAGLDEVFNQYNVTPPSNFTLGDINITTYGFSYGKCIGGIAIKFPGTLERSLGMSLLKRTMVKYCKKTTLGGMQLEKCYIDKKHGSINLTDSNTNYSYNTNYVFLKEEGNSVFILSINEKNQSCINELSKLARSENKGLLPGMNSDTITALTGIACLGTCIGIFIIFIIIVIKLIKGNKKENINYKNNGKYNRKA